MLTTTLSDPSPVDFDGVIVGDSIHMGQHSRSLAKWLSRHHNQLVDPPVALFQVSLTSVGTDQESDDEAHRLTLNHGKRHLLLAGRMGAAG